MKKLIKEPLVHFLIIGAGLFLLYTLKGNRYEKDEIIIDQYVINDLSAKWNMQWHRQPNINELKRLVKLYVNQELLYREALDMNLDHNDEIIKRRLAKKMEFISDDLAELLQPSEEMLLDYFENHRENYKKPAIFTFYQIYFNPQKRDDPAHDALEAMTAKDPQKLGDKLSLPVEYDLVDGLKIAIDFGKGFAGSLDTLTIGKWSGPIRSGYGVHIVFIKAKQASGFYKYEDVVEKINLDYNFQASNDFKNELIKTLLKDYKIKFELNDVHLEQELVESY